MIADSKNRAIRYPLSAVEEWWLLTGTTERIPP